MGRAQVVVALPGRSAMTVHYECVSVSISSFRAPSRMCVYCWICQLCPIEEET